MITADDVRLASDRIAGEVRRTPALDLGPTVLKLEYLQHTGSFKARGAFNRVLAARESGELDPAIGIVIASGGNAALANAYAAARVGVPATVFVPTTAPPFKVDKLRALGATVIQHGDEYAAAYEAALKHVADTGAIHCHAYDQAEIVAGAGTVGSELLSQVDSVDTVLVAVGGGGLMAGIAAAVHGTSRVVAVEPDTCPTLHAALAHGSPVDVGVSGIAADSLGARRCGAIAYNVAVHTGVRSLLVSDEDITGARRRLWDDYRIVVETGAAAAYAALTAGAYRPSPGERVAVILCGANTDPATL